MNSLPFITILLVALTQNFVSANVVGFGAGLVGVKIDPKCNAVIEKWTKVAENKIFKDYIKQKKCIEAKCRAKFEEVIKYWPQVRASVDKILEVVAKTGGPNTKALPGSCAFFQKDLDAVLWGEVNKVADMCVLKSGYDELKGDPCKVQKGQLVKTGDCIKGEALRLVMKYVGLLKMDKVKKCFNEILQKYCNEKYLGQWFKYNLEDSFVNRKEYGAFNAYNHIDKYFGEYNCIAHPIVN